MESQKILLRDPAIESDDLLEERSVKATRALLQTFLQTVKAFRLYEADHPILNKFLERLKRDFDHYFEEFDSFPLLVGEYRLFYRGRVVYENQDIKESLAFFFYRDGIREIKFIRGLELREIVDFLQVVRKGESVNRMEDDLVTLLWEKDFAHITFGVVDEFIDPEGSFVPASPEEWPGRLELKSRGEGSYEPALVEEVPDGAKGLRVEGLKQAINLQPGQSLVEACQLTPDEIGELAREMEREFETEYHDVVIDNLIEILLHLGDDLDAYENMIAYFERTIASFLEKGEIRKATTVLQKLHHTMESIVLKDRQIFAIRRILDSFSRPSSIERIGELMAGEGEVDAEAILQYLRLLTPKSVEPLCLLLGKLESGRWRKAICEVIAHLAQTDLQPLIKFLSDPNPFIVRHILYILGRIGNPSALRYLGPLVVHPDSQVREEVLQLLLKSGEPAKDLLSKFLKDPLAKIRIKAALAFAKIAGKEAVKPLQAIILSEDFLKRDYEEKASFFRALGETGSEEAIPMLEEIVKKRRWLQRGKWKEMRLCAQHALKMLGAKEAEGGVAKRPKGEPKPLQRLLPS
ncbi:MAG: HEAT repeat domain-containing protein [Desulfobacterota bacterium]|nr:HEAT repeat domain-containing protein [Thermodesulfobacteriota bacterium]